MQKFCICYLEEFLDQFPLWALVVGSLGHRLKDYPFGFTDQNYIDQVLNYKNVPKIYRSASVSQTWDQTLLIRLGPELVRSGLHIIYDSASQGPISRIIFWRQIMGYWLGGADYKSRTQENLSRVQIFGHC